MAFDQRQNEGDHARAPPGGEVGDRTRRGTQLLLRQARSGPSALASTASPSVFPRQGCVPPDLTDANDAASSSSHATR